MLNVDACRHHRMHARVYMMIIETRCGQVGPTRSSGAEPSVINIGRI